MTQSSRVNDASPPVLDVEFTITNIVGLSMTTAVSEIHLEAFQDYLNARLGLGYARTLIQWFVRQEDAIALATIDHNHQIIGYALGAPVSLGRKLRSDMFGVTVRCIVLHPWVLFDKRLWKMGRARFRIKRNSEKTDRGPNLAEPIFSLRAIGVRSSHRQMGVGKLLLHAFEERAKILKAKSLLLWVYSDKAATRGLYEKCGWQACPESTTTSGTMKYVRVLDSYRT